MWPSSWVPWACPWHGYGLEFGAQPKLVDEGASWLLKLATFMAEVHVELAHLFASIQNKIFIHLILQKSYGLI